MIGLRRLVARTANWQKAPGTTWTRLLERLGLLEWLRRRELLSHISNLGSEADARLMAASGINPADSLSYHRAS